MQPSVRRALAIGAAVSAVVAALAAISPFSPSTKVDDAAVAAGDAGRGASLYAGSCAGCHGLAGEGGVGPPLAGAGLAAADVVRTIAAGGGVMPAGLLDGADAADAAAFVVALGDEAGAVAGETTAPATATASTASGPAAELYSTTCAGCHGLAGEGGAGPRLAGSGLDATTVAARIAAGGRGMPGGLLVGDEADAVATFVAELAGGSTTLEPPPETTAETPETTAAAETAAETGVGAGETTTDEEPTAKPIAATTVRASRRARRRLAPGAAQVDVLVEHVRFLDEALAEGNTANVRFHGEHLRNIVLGNPAEDVDRDGQKSNPGDGVGIVGRASRGHVLRIRARLGEIAADAALPAELREAARAGQRTAVQSTATSRRIASLARDCARVTRASAATDEVARIDALRTTAQTLWERLATTVEEPRRADRGRLTPGARAVRAPRPIIMGMSP